MNHTRVRAKIAQAEESLRERLSPNAKEMLSIALDLVDLSEACKKFEIASSWDTDNNSSEVLFDVARDVWTSSLWGDDREVDDDTTDDAEKMLAGKAGAA